MSILVMKFGGTSVQSAERIQSVADIVGRARKRSPVYVVVSAMAGVTNDLLHAAQIAADGDKAWEALIDGVIERHLVAASALASPEDAPELATTLHSLGTELRSLVQGVSLVRDASARVLDGVLAHGELMSAPLVAAALRARGIAARTLDAREIIRTDEHHGQAIVDRATTYERARARLADVGEVPVITGFIAATENGSTTTLGRGGSDYTATLIGAAVAADAVEIWTDVDGVMSADPRIVKQAFSLPVLSYTELMELSHFGARVIYPPSVTPARDAGIALIIRNTLNPDFPGTKVLPQTDTDPEHAGIPRFAVRGISSINNVAICRLEGAGMLGVAGIASRLFGALARDGISVILISQASSEHSICFALEPAAVSNARRRVDAEFAVERRAGAVDPLVVESDFSVIAAVGEAMRHTPGISGRLFDVLGRNGVNVRAIAQGSSELNISLVVARMEEPRALRLIHEAFFYPRIRNVDVFIAGTGRVGAALLDQLAHEAKRLPTRTGVRLQITGIARSNTALIDERGIDLTDWRSAVASAASSPKQMFDTALGSPSAHRVFVDCTASSDVSAMYEPLLRSGVAIVSANKIALSASSASYRTLKQAAMSGNGLYTETTVGAGLPVLRPVADLVATGDEVASIEGVLSGTLSFLFGRIMAGASFSAAVKEAHGLGFTEPDPREDLSGRDVARKLLILGREAGFEIEPEQLRVESVLPGARWAELSMEEFWSELPTLDDEFAAKREAAIKSGAVLSYLGSIERTGSQVALRTIDRSHPCAALSPGDNIIAVTSNRYRERPLIIRGPGAGPDVTAAGVFADILRAAIESR